MGGALRAGNWKLVLNGNGHGAGTKVRESGGEPSPTPVKVELFDLATDPGEQRNLAEANSGKVQSCAPAIRRWRIRRRRRSSSQGIRTSRRRKCGVKRGGNILTAVARR